MSHRPFTESTVKAAALDWLAEVGYTVLVGPDIAPGEPGAERESYRQVVLPARLRRALARLNPSLAFYDALADNRSAIEVMGDETLAVIARELIPAVRKNVSIDWTVKESARARIRIAVKRILRRYGYPPDLQEKATDTVLAQAELLAAGWAE
jgi:type I site-specific restriction-modification system R (restriction) subunit